MYSVKLLEELLNLIPNLKWKSLDKGKLNQQDIHADYKLIHKYHKCSIIELKEMKNAEKIQKQVNKGLSKIGGSLNEKQRIRDNIGKAGKQLKKYQSLKIPLGFITCGSGIVTGNFKDLAAALFGDPEVKIDTGEYIFNRNKALLPNKNTTISYLGWLERKEINPRLQLIHNEFSHSKLHFDFFSSSLVEQHIVELITKSEIEGKMVRVNSPSELNKVRESNVPILKILLKKFQ
ncbi:MAG: hypothetical protein HYU97_08830 [Deltaproteobacteria bacterium]|nr:hypothetical protein [Deltaproteobacteria bacterium]